VKRNGAGWMRAVLLAAAAYNVLWGGLVILFPFAVFDVLGMERPNYPQIWQCIGMIVGVYGVGYAAAALDPLRHWPVVLVGLLGKVFGPIGFLSAVVGGTLPLSFGLTILTNDLIWWLPFALILLRAYQSNKTPRGANA
jgi:small multidrug resistance pump